jgi:hypothetical protein
VSPTWQEVQLDALAAETGKVVAKRQTRIKQDQMRSRALRDEADQTYFTAKRIGFTGTREEWQSKVAFQAGQFKAREAGR